MFFDTNLIGPDIACKYAMKYRLFQILVLAGTIIIGLSAISVAADMPSEVEQDLLNLINEARANPLEMASSLGVDPEKVLADLPELHLILKEGLPPLSFDSRLFQSASNHGLDMLAQNYYSNDSLDGRTYSDRILGSGYPATLTGESLGVVGFNNFLGPDEAVWIIFEKIFKDELDPNKTERRNLLDPAFTNAGVGISSGTYQLNGGSWNVYMATCDFATDVINTASVEAALLEMINKARKDPISAFAAVGIDEATARTALGDDAYLLDEGLPPLAMNEKLREAALAYEHDIAGWPDPDTISLEDPDLAERIADTGYDAISAGELVGGFFNEDFVPALKSAQSIYEAMLLEELTLTSGERNIFSSLFTEAGIVFEPVVLSSDVGEDSPDGYVVVADFAQPYEMRAFLVGNVYHDRNRNGNIDPGEGVEGIKVSLRQLLSFQPVTDGDEYGEITEEAMYTGPRGSYQIRISPLAFGEVVVTWDGGEPLERYGLSSLSENEHYDFLISKEVSE